MLLHTPWKKGTTARGLSLPTPPRRRTGAEAARDRRWPLRGRGGVALILVVGLLAAGAIAGDAFDRPVADTPRGELVNGKSFAQALRLVTTDRPQAVDGSTGNGVVALAPPALPSDTAGFQPAPAEQVPLEPSVPAFRPRLRVPEVADPAVVAAVRDIEGVASAAAARVTEVPVLGAEGPQTVRLAAVDPVEFRPLTPQVTADEVAVWERLRAGDAAFTHDVGGRLLVPLGTTVSVADAPSGVRIGAYASNGIPPVADALISRQRADSLGLGGVEQLYVAVTEDANLRAVQAALADVTGAAVEILEEPSEQRAFLTGGAARNAFEPFNYIDHGDGLITIESGWVGRNIVSAPVPIFGSVTCHRQMIPQLRGALQEIVDLGLADLIDTSQYGGCWVPRHIDFRADKPISMHAWGLAIDFNVSTNGLGAIPQLDGRIVQVFDRWGFVWGGRWNRPDGMHFELGALLQ